VYWRNSQEAEIGGKKGRDITRLHASENVSVRGEEGKFGAKPVHL